MNGETKETRHDPVLLQEVLELLATRPGASFIDGTVGGGGHAEALLRHSGPGSRLLGIDRDGEALERAGRRLAVFGDDVVLAHGNFADMREHARANGWEAADGILLDLGMSSDQLDTAERGFSFQKDGPLDMRMDDSQETTAETLVNNLTEKELADCFWRLGEEPASRRIAKAVVRERRREPIRTTARLAETVARAVGGRRSARHPATRVFQALRMAVNREMEALHRGIEEGLALLAPGGRMAVIAFHSLEDRAVKEGFGGHAGRAVSLPEGGSRWEGNRPRMRWIQKRPLKPRAEETARNPRARSARLRAVEATDS